MRKYNCIAIIILIFFLGTILSCANNFLRVKGKISIEEAKAIANQALREHGHNLYNPEEMEIKADKGNSVWKDYVSIYPDLLESEKLKNKNYWAIYYCPYQSPGEYTLGGDAFVFVDSDNGNVIDVMLFK